MTTPPPMDYSTVNATALLNRTQLDQLRQLEAFKPGVRNELVTMFSASSGRQLQAFTQAAAASDLAALRRVAHSLKGVSASLGAARLSALAGLIEAQAGADDAAALDALEPLTTVIEASLGGLQSWLHER